MGNIDEEGCQRLAQEIIVHAAREYRSALKMRKKGSNKKKAEGMIEEIERFFYSDWYKVLTDVPAETILEGLRKEEEL